MENSTIERRSAAYRKPELPGEGFESSTDQVAAVGDIQDVIETAIGGKNVTYTVEGRERYPVRVRYARDFREDIGSLRNVIAPGANGAPVPLAEVARIGLTIGPSMITSENSLLRGTVLMNVRGRDVGGFVDEAKRVVAKRVAMPRGRILSRQRRRSDARQNDLSFRNGVTIVRT